MIQRRDPPTGVTKANVKFIFLYWTPGFLHSRKGRPLIEAACSASHVCSIRVSLPLALFWLELLTASQFLKSNTVIVRCCNRVIAFSLLVLVALYTAEQCDTSGLRSCNSYL